MFVDRDSQCTGPYAEVDPLAALAQRWMRNARKTAVSDQLELQAGEPHEAAPCEHAVPAAEDQRGAAVHRTWDSDAGMAELPWPWRTMGERGDAGLHPEVHGPGGVHRWALSTEELEPWWPTA